MSIGFATITMLSDPLRPSSDELIGRLVRVYRNLNNGMWSIQTKVPAGKNGQMEWRVVLHTTGAVVTDARFIVSEAGRQRVIRERRKNVHAYVEGTFSAMRAWDVVAQVSPVTYDPYHLGTFTRSFMKVPIKNTPFAIFKDGKLFAADEIAKITTLVAR